MVTSEERLVFVDNLRVLLIVFVILGHLAITYGSPVGDWYYHEGAVGSVEGVFYVALLGAGQSFSMGLFFLISGYFTPRSYDRKGFRLFLRDRLFRLGLPLLVYVVFIDPLIRHALAVSVEGFSGSFLDFVGSFVTHYKDLGSGPLWFLEAVLMFSVVYALWRRSAKKGAVKAVEDCRLPGNWSIAVFALILGLVTFVLRIWFPIGYSFGPLNLQFGFFPQYVAMFAVGLIAFGRGWLLRMPSEMGRMWLRVSMVLLLILPFLFVCVSVDGDPFRLAGGFYMQSLMYALWEQAFGVAVIVGLSVWFRERFNHQGRLMKAMSAGAYATYIVHAPVLVLVSLGLRGFEVPLSLKFVLVAPIAVSLCFLLGNCGRRLSFIAVRFPR